LYIFRYQACIESGESKNIVFSVDDGKWYQKEVSDTLSQIKQDSNQAEKIPLLPNGLEELPGGNFSCRLLLWINI
jgi:hypothetical protein